MTAIDRSDVVPAKRWLRVLIVVAGLVLPQVVLYAPSLSGARLLLPLDILRLGTYYVPPSAGGAPVYSSDVVLGDAVEQFEPMRRFAISELRAGRFPLWRPGVYGGAPFLAQNQPGVLSPLHLLDYAWESPRVLAWREMLKALLAGAGAFLFFRLALGAGFWAAALGAWCFPLCGFLVLWANHPHSSVALWLPWMLLATERTLRFPRGLGPIGLAATTALALVSGHSGVAAHLMMGSGLYAIGRLAAERSARRIEPLGMLAAGWILGAMLSAPQTLPTLEYLASSARIADRLAGQVDTVPAGPAALIQLILPNAFGSNAEGFVYAGVSLRSHGNQLESAATGYVGLLVALAFFPAGIATRRGRPFLGFIALFVIVGLARIVDLPGSSTVFSLRPLATLRNHRMVLLTGFAVLSGAVLGIDALLAGERPPRWLRHALVAVCAAVAAWATYRALVPPPTLRAMIEEAA
jgi:hypothetical protein